MPTLDRSPRILRPASATGLCLALITAIATPACLGAPASSPRLCVFDLLGTSGDMYNATKDYVLAMQSATGITLTARAYTDERIAMEDFRTGQCEALLATTFRTRAFNPVTATTDAFGATLILRQGKVDMAAGHQVMRLASQTFNTPGATTLVVQGKYEMAGLIDVGAVYGLVNDRRINSPEAMAGKRMLAFDHDKAQAHLIQKAGAQAVSADITNFATKFNNGMADMAATPAVAFRPLELHKGVGSKGAISRFPFMIMSYQLIIDRSKLPTGFGDASRRYWFEHFDEVLNVVRKAEADIPAALWMDLPAEQLPRYAQYMREARVELAEQGLYDKQGLKLLKRIRCKVEPSDADCATASEINWAK
jgi:hypothetical protein